MRTSDYFDLNLVEGTDLVNPLIQDVPNYEKIDEQMYLNSIASIGQAVELKSGTVHAITRENPDASMFRFVATSRYDEGDTFTVDGVQVTGLLTDGTTLADGAYVINANVLCCLVGTVLTLYTVAGAIQTAQNALKLGGEEPSYYGTASDVQTATNTANAAGLLSNSAIDLARETSAKVRDYGCLYNPADDYVYIGGKKWKKAFLNGMLYDNGANTDNWLGVLSPNYTRSATINNTYLETYGFSGGVGAFITREKIDITNFTKLHVIVEEVENNWGSNQSAFGLQNVQSVNDGGVQGNMIVYTNVSQRYSGELELDITNYNGEYYIAMGSGIGGVAQGIKANWKKVWLT